MKSNSQTQRWYKIHETSVHHWSMVSHLKIFASKEQRTDDEVKKKMPVLINLFESELHTWIKAFNYCRQTLETWSMKKILKDIKVALKTDIHANVMWLNKEAWLTSTAMNWNTMQTVIVWHQCSQSRRLFKGTQAKQQSHFPKQFKKNFFNLHYNDSSQFKWISQCIHKVHIL